MQLSTGLLIGLTFICKAYGLSSIETLCLMGGPVLLIFCLQILTNKKTFFIIRYFLRQIIQKRKPSSIRQLEMYLAKLNEK